MMSKRQNKSRRRSLILFVVVVIMATTTLLLSTFIHSQPITLIITENGRCKIESPTFALSWIHSVDKTPWIEFYQRQDEGFILTHTKFKTFGAGVPHDGIVLDRNDDMIHYQIDHFMPEINWVVDRDVRSSLYLSEDQPWEIYREVDRYSEVEFRNRSFNFWQRLSIRNCHEPQ
ncbi:DUF1850 domain-containing protein [Ignatzschineria cameli]|nr:DUF1850 domain-containing protein [Ignatzschineria cameli]